MILFVGVGVSYGAEAWIKENETSVRISDLTTTIHIHIKNNKDHVQYFKISQKYYDDLDKPINWTIAWTNPAASKMIKSVDPQLGGDYGWKIEPGETKTICFKLNAYGLLGEIPSLIINKDAVENQYWPLIPEPGLMSSWFVPNEIEMLNPDLDLQYWEGRFSFKLTNIDSKKISGIVRAPIVPVNSKLIYSKPQVTFQDKDLALNTNIAAWDVTMEPGASRYFTYVYKWPATTTHTTSGGKYSSPIPTTSAAKTTSSVPTPQTGTPYGLLVIAAVLTGAGVVYAKYMR